MKRQFSLLLQLILLLALSACGITKPSSQPVTAFTHVNLIPMTSEKVIEDQTVLVKGSEIVAIGGSDTLKIPRGAQVIDGKGAYLMPGLADMHMHTRPNWDDPASWPVNPLYLYLANGVTAIRDETPIGSDITYALQWQDEIRSGSRIGPTLYTSGVRLDGSPLEDPAKIVRQNFDQGFDFQKVYSFLSVEDFQAGMRESRELGMYTVGHIPLTVGLDGALAEGMDGIAHVEELSWEFIPLDRSKQWTVQNFYLENHIAEAVNREVDISSSDTIDAWEREHMPDLERIANQLRTAGVPVDITMYASEFMEVIASQPEVWLSHPELKYEMTGCVESLRRGEVPYQILCRNMGRICQDFLYDFHLWILSGLHEGGVQLLLSTDSGAGNMGIVPGFSIHDELRILVENGFTPYEALLTGTGNAATVVEKMTGKGNFGTIEVGNRADLILVSKNPLEDLTTIKEPLGVMAAGRWYSAEALAKLIEIPGST